MSDNLFEELLESVREGGAILRGEKEASRMFIKASYDFAQGKRGAIDPLPPGKTRITIRIDDDILEWFREQVNIVGGGNYQTLINHALREYVQNRTEPLEEILRRVVREELLATYRNLPLELPKAV